MPAAPRSLRCLLSVVTAAAMAGGLVISAPAASAAPRCSLPLSPVGDPYQVTICVDMADGPLSGDQQIVATATVTPGAGGAPAVSKVAFSHVHDGVSDYLLTDHDAEPATSPPVYQMTWRTARALSSTGALRVRARMTDGFAADFDIPVTLADAGTAAPNTNQFQVRTGQPPASGQRFRLVAVGDASSGSQAEQQLASQVASWAPNLVTYLGDVYERGSAYEFDNWYASPSGFGRFRSITNPTVGNHEYFTPGATGYFEYWDNIPHYYSYDVAGWHIVTIDSTDDYNQLTPGTAQYDWLAADLAANRARCTIVTMHHPRYSLAAGGGRSGLEHVWSLLAARRVTLAVAGHAHHYEQWQPLDGTGGIDPRGVTQFIAGAGGHEVAPAVLTDPRSVATIAEPGALRLDLGTDDVSFSYVNIAGEVRDAGTVGCKSTGDTLPPSTPSVAATATSASTAEVTWPPSTDEFGVSGYTVRRNGSVVATLGAGTTSYGESGLTSGATYSWTVDAFDSSQNLSPQSAPVSVTMPGAPATVSSRPLLRALRIAPETPRGYQRDRFRTWTDADGDACNTRAEVLLSEALLRPTVLAGCGLSSGRWLSRYDGVRIEAPLTPAIEHLVPLREVWQSGARAWRPVSRRQLANDLGFPHTLNVVTKRMLRAKGSDEPTAWMPPKAGVRCAYLAEWVAVKWRWRLAVDRPERRFLASSLRRCGWPQVTKPARAPITRR